ncbi:MAG: ACT domain-containing protein [Actinomycetes bacterium]|nr:ACT domain-containing protein [Actinomycetes bacterium]MDX5380062.1 ACT domain-containing protein [Actinomycetes bacterium]MDX5398631.1 ACT domain-containing protein [Actinomycetes bacterium]MDX5449770.1 ACT domain-containing protein [Actinomycetes bacterium]
MLGDQHVRVLQQISVFLENRPGQLAEFAAALAERGVNLRALSLAETDRFGIARAIADAPETALAALHEAGMTATVTDVVGVEVPDRPGGLAHLLDVFDGVVSVEYMYAAFPGAGGRRVLIMKLTPVDLARDILGRLYEE